MGEHCSELALISCRFGACFFEEQLLQSCSASPSNAQVVRFAHFDLPFLSRSHARLGASMLAIDLVSAGPILLVHGSIRPGPG